MVEHVIIEDAQRHEVKHASTAVANQSLLSNGDGTTRFSYVDYNTLTNIPAQKGYKLVFTGYSSAATQNPTAVDTPLQIEFGAGGAFTDASLAASGLLTFNTPGDFIVTLFLRFGRTSGAGSAVLLSRFLLNGVQGLNSNALKLGDADTVIPFSTSVNLTVAAGNTFQVQVMRDSAGVNNGGLTRILPTVASWNLSPTATIVVSKYVGNI